MELLLVNALKTVLLPPGMNIVLALLALAFWWRMRTTAVTLLTLSFVLLYALSTPGVSRILAATLERDPPITRETQLGDYWQAIAVLGGGRYDVMPEYGTEVPKSGTLERIRFAVNLHKQTGLPLLVSGGTVFGGGVSEAQLMSEVMVSDYGIRPRWIESSSRNTAENAIYSKRILSTDNIDKVLLVTHALHMRRAAMAFKSQGLAVKPAPTIFRSFGNHQPLWMQWFPSAGALLLSRDAMHEYIGLLWYTLRY